MKWKKVWSLICTVGLPWGIITAGTAIYLKYLYIINNPRQYKVKMETIEDIKGILIGSACVMGWIFIKNLAHIGTGKDIRMTTWLTKHKYEPPDVSKRKIDAMHPPIDKEYLSSVPDGLVLGYSKRDKKYIRYPISKNHALSAILVGLPGSGKSTLLISSLAYQNHFATKEDRQQSNFFNKGNRQKNQNHFHDKDRQVYFILDCKPELKKKTTYPYDKHMCELSIDDRSQCGWDVYHELDKCKNDDDRLSALDVIARALIDAGKNSKNEFFYQSGRAIIKALFLAYYKAGRTFGQSLHILRESNIQDLIKTTLENTNGNPELIKVKRGLKQYEGKEGEAFQGIGLAINEAIEILDKDDVEFFLDINPRKLSCDTLEEKVSIAFTLQVAKIREYKTILRLVVMQLISHCEQRSEDSHLITMIIDEAYRLGVINWIDFLKQWEFNVNSITQRCAVKSALTVEAI